MDCAHPECRLQPGGSWEANLSRNQINIKETEYKALVTWLNGLPQLGIGTVDPPAPGTISNAGFKRVMENAPCLYAQIKLKPTARGIVHLTEVTMTGSITSENVHQAFRIQHPGKFPGEGYRFPPALTGKSPGAGDITEALCSELLTNHGVPAMGVDKDGYPDWKTPSHVSLNHGKLAPLKLYGDLLIPAAPHNILISVKTEAARERLVVSGNRLESVGFGFFSEAKEFWTSRRINLYKRWGFIAIYMPTDTLNSILAKLTADNRLHENININGKPLFRPLEAFGDDMRRIAGRLTTEL